MPPAVDLRLELDALDPRAARVLALEDQRLARALDAVAVEVPERLAFERAELALDEAVDIGEEVGGRCRSRDSCGHARPLPG